MKELVKIVFVLAFLLSFCVGNLSAQYAKLVDSKKYSKTEMSLFNASVGYFEVGDYTNAYMGFSQLHSWYASDPVFSYYCGASMVMLRNEYDKAIKYLTLAYDNNLYEADYYLGLAYHRKYLFSKSITFYSRYRDYLVQATKGKSPKIAEVEALMGKANKARTLGQESYVLKVISNNKVKRSNFHFSYGRKILDGNLVVKPDFFRQRNDKNNKDIDLVYVLDTIAFVSSYGNDMKTGLDLYVSRKTDEGWSPLQLLPGMVNTDYDEAFPFLSSDGVLYFASKGHNSIGGYDIFKSEYDAGLGLWGNPENLGFPINTPYDDFMYAIESNGNSAFFASDRSSKDGQVMVCRYIVEEIPEKIHIETEEHLAEQAELPITPGAEAEYNRILQEQKDKENEKLQDSVVENQEIKQEQDTSDLYVATKSMLEKKVSAVSNYQDYSKKLNAYARITSNKIRAIRNGESDADMSSSDITKMANSVVTCYDLSQKFNSVYSTAKPTLDYCTKEMSFLDKLETGSGEYQFKLQNLNVSVEKVNAKSPLETLIEEKKNERKQADDALKKLSRNMGKIQRTLRDINNDLEAKMLAIQNETDPMLREKYINEHKALENSKIDVISSKKNMDIEAKRLNAMMARANETLKMLEDIEDILANLDLSELDETEDIGANDILALQNFISDEDNKEIAEYEKEVENDESLYSEKIDYEAIAANSSSALTDIVNEVSEYKDDMSKSTSAVVGMIVQSDSLYSQKSRFEVQFDAADSDEEKKDLLDKINATQKQIVEKGKAIESGLVYEPNPLVSKAIDDFNSIKQEKINSSDWPELVSSTQNLIEKSRKLESQISESKSEANVGVDKAKLLEKIKSDIDNQIVGNVEEMQGIVVAQQSGKKDIASMNAEIAKIRSSAKDKTAETEVKKDLNSASKKVLESKQGDSNSVAILNDAENILVGAVEKRIAILTEEYEAESKVYDVLAGKYVRSKSTENQKQQADVIYYSALEERQLAESATDEVEKMKYLSEANKKLKSANSALLQVVSPNSKSETQQKDVLTQDILSLYDDIKEQKDVSSHTESVDLSHILSNTNPPTEPVEVKGNETSIQNTQQNGVAEGSGNTIPPQSIQHSVSLQTDLTKRISTNNDDITTIATNLATASRTEKKRLQTELGEVISERDGNVRTLGEEKQHFYSELDKVINEEISKTTVSAEYANRYADYRRSLYSLINADSSFADMTEKLAEAEKSEYALLQTIIPNVNDGMAAVLIDIYSVLDDKYGVALSTELAESTNSNRAITDSNEVQNVAVPTSQSVIVSNNPSSHPPTEPVDPSRPLSVAEESGNDISAQNSQQNGVAEGSGSTISSQSLQHSVTMQTDLTKRISTNNDDITTIATNMATANRSEKKRLETYLGEVISERDDNVRTLGEEKQRFYAELDKAKHDEIVKTSASSGYTNRYADYRQSLYSLTNADPSSADMTEKLTEAEKSEYALLQTIIPNVDAETKSVLMPIYNSLDAKYGNLASSSTSTNLQSGVEGKNNENTTTSPQLLQHSVTMQTDLTKRISTNNDDITTIATNMATADRGEKKRLETFLGEVTAERNDNVRTLGEEKQRFYAELDKAKHDDIAKTSASTDYTNRYADYRQSLYSLTNADPSSADMTEKLADAEKSEYALLQTIIPNVDTETSIVLVQIYSELDAKYGNTSPAEPVEASASSLAQNDPMSTSQSVIVSNNPSSNPPAEPVDPSRPLSVAEGSDNETSIQNAQHNGVVEGLGRPISSLSLQHSVTLQTDLTKRISTNNDDITTIATNMATADRGEKKRLETFLGEVTSERNDNVRTLGEEKQRFYAELDKAKHDDIAKTSASTDYTNRYADYRQSLYGLTNADPSSADMTERLAEAEKSEYALLQTIIPNVDAETKSVLMPIYNGLDEKYGNLASATSTNQQNGVEAKDNGNTISSSQSLQHSVTLQTDLTKRISTNNNDITTIATNMATADRGEKKRLETFLGEVTAERNDNVRTLGEEKQRFYAELDKSKHDDIAKTGSSTDYTNRYADYRQSLYSLTNADPSSADMTERLAEAEKSEYALLQTIIPNVDVETKSVLMPIYNGLDEKYGNLASSTSTNQQNGVNVVPDNVSNAAFSSQSLQHSVTLQTDLTKRISTNNDDITTIATNMATADRGEKKRLETFLGEVTAERNDNVRTLGEEKQRFYAELDKSKHDDIAKTSASTDYTNRYADYRQSLYSLTNADPSSADMTERLAEAEKSEYALLQTIIPNVDAETKSVLMPIYNSLDAKYGNLASSSTSTNQQSVVEEKDNGNTISSSQSLQHSVTLQTDLTKRITTNNDDITTIATNMATADRGEKKRLETFLGEVTAERNDNVRTLGEEKQRFYAELDKSKHDDIAKTGSSTDYTNRYADYRQSLYSLTNADPSSADMTEKLADAEKSEYALLQTIITNVDAETKSVLMPIYNGLDEKYGNLASATLNNQQSGIDGKNNENTTSSSQTLQHSVTLQTDLTKRISTNNDDITTISTNMATADRSEKKRLQSFLGEITAERNDNVRTLGEEKQRFYAELDKSKHDDIAKTSASTDYTNRYADYRQSLYTLTNADPSSADMTEKLAEAEKSEYALLQTIIPNVDAETKSILMPIYNGLDEKYGNLASATSTNQQSGDDSTHTQSGIEVTGNDATAQNSQQNGVAKELDDNSAITTSVDSQQLKASVVRQSEISNRITINASEISAIEGVIAASAGSDKQRLQNELGEIAAQRNSNVRSLSEEKQHFYAEIDKSVHDAIAKSDVSSEYTNRYTTYRQSLHNLANAEQSGADMSQKLAEAEMAEYALLQTIIPNADSETKSILLPVYNGLEAKYGTTGGVEIAGVVPETYSRSMTLQEQMVRNIEISTKEIERLEQRKEVAKKSEQRRIADDIAREESQKLDDIQKLAVEKSKFYSELNSSLKTILPTLSDSARQEYKLAYDSYDETLRTMKIGLGFYDMSVANKIYNDSEIQEYKLLQQMSQVATGETKTVVDNMIGRMEANNSTLRRYKVVVDYVIVENTVNNSSTNSNVAEKRDSVSLNIPDSNSTILASVDSTVVTPKKKSMSGFSADSYGIFEKPEINMGLYYRIQIVAANVKYRMSYFNGLSLIFTEQIPNTNIIRYMTGEYYRYVSAREDLPKVRGLGFSDAFIVAYYNGKRISIGEARRLEALQNAEENEEIPIVIRHEAPADYVEPESIIASSQTKTETISNAENGASVANNSASGQSVTEGTSAVYSENVAENGQIVSSENVVDSQGGIAVDSHEIPSKGVYYAVQIGVYKDRRQPSQMKGVSPIDYETMPNGYIRHTSGRFGNYDQARASQVNIRRQGISDAFVIAYIDGRKVSFSEAVEYQKSLENRVIAEANTENTTSKTQGVVSSEENLSNVEYAPLNLNTGTEENNKEGISYYVQIGAFSKSPDPEILSVFSKVAGDKIHVKFPREGLQVYRIGVFSSYEEAQNTLAEARSFGIVDAFIVAFKGEEQISSSEAIRLQNAVRQIEGNSGETINNNVGQKSISQNVQPSSNAEPKPVVPAETLQQASGGVEYFVQLGAFVHTPDTRSMATFRAIATTSGSRLSTVQNGKFTNYRVGAFKKFDDVKAAVENARSMGVTDAFVVAFYNGERIPVVEAKEKE